MNVTQEEKIKQFVSDRTMSDAVYNNILQSFLKPVEHGDVHVLAAYKVATDLLRVAFKELGRFTKEQDVVEKRVGQVGL